MIVFLQNFEHFSNLYFMEHLNLSLHKKSPYSEFFWSVFSRIRTEYGSEKLRTRTLFTQCIILKYIHFRGRVGVVPYYERVNENSEDYFDNTEDHIDRSSYENAEDYYREKTRRINEYYKQKYAGKNNDWHEPPGDIIDRSNYNNLEDYYREKYRKINKYYEEKYTNNYDYSPQSRYTKHEDKNNSTKSRERTYHLLFTALFAGDILITLACVILLIPYLRKMNIIEGMDLSIVINYC